MADIAQALATANMNIYNGLSDRALLTVRYATAKRMEDEIAKLNQKYDGRKAADIEAKINSMADEAMAVSTYVTRLDSGLKRVTEVREQLIAMQTAIDKGAGPALDLAVRYLNSILGKSWSNTESLMANPSPGSGTWTEKTASVAGGGMSEDVSTHFLGSDYVLQLDDGSSMTVDEVEGTLAGPNGSVKMADIVVDSHDADDRVTLRDSTTGATFTGQLKRAGLSMLNAWGYENLTTPEGKAKAQEDLNKAIKYVTNSEREWLKDQTMMAVMQKTVGTKLEQLKDEYDKVSTEELDAKQAERRSLQTRFDMFNNSLAMTQGRATVLVTQLFSNKSGYEKPTWNDIMNKANGLG